MVSRTIVNADGNRRNVSFATARVRGFQSGIDTRMIAPHVTHLEDEPFLGREIHDLLEIRHVVSGGFFKMEILSRIQHCLRVGGVFRHPRFYSDHLDLGMA